MNKLIFFADSDWTGFILRMTIGLILFPHGAQKVFGWFGGPGFTGEMEFFTQKMGLPWLIGFLVILIESAGSVFLLAGFASRLWSVALIILFLGMILTVHQSNGFFMNWYGNQKGEGYEYHLLVIGLSLALLLNGSGKFSFDRLFYTAG